MKPDQRKGLKETLRKVIIGILNVGIVYITIVLSITVTFFMWYGGDGPGQHNLPVGFIIAPLPLLCFDLVMVSCAITDLIMAIKLKRNPYDEKSRNIRRKAGKVFLVSFEALIVVGLLEGVLLILGHS